MFFTQSKLTQTNTSLKIVFFTNKGGLRLTAQTFYSYEFTKSLCLPFPHLWICYFPSYLSVLEHDGLPKDLQNPSPPHWGSKQYKQNWLAFLEGLSKVSKRSYKPKHFIPSKWIRYDTIKHLKEKNPDLFLVISYKHTFSVMSLNPCFFLAMLTTSFPMFSWLVPSTSM